MSYRKLKEDMEMTKSALENERKIQHLQMQAINALWKKVSTMQQPVTIPTGVTGTSSIDGAQQCLDISGAGVIQDLAKTCSILNNQVIFDFCTFLLLIYTFFIK